MKKTTNPKLQKSPNSVVHGMRSLKLVSLLLMAGAPAVYAGSVSSKVWNKPSIVQQ